MPLFFEKYFLLPSLHVPAEAMTKSSLFFSGLARQDESDVVRLFFGPDPGVEGEQDLC